MNYQDKTVGITGFEGFIGKELVVALQDAGANVVALLGDVRDPVTFSVIDHSYDYVFHFADPSSQVLFKRQAMYAAEVTIKGFINAAKACRQHGVKLIYPSTGLLSQNRQNEYARCKKICEDIQLGENLDALAIRIFATYGSGEGHKRDYASVPFLFVRDMLAGRSPVIFGDGEQKRDFIYIADAIQGILTLAEECNDPVIDLGSGHGHSFLEIIKIINKTMHGGATGEYIEPDFVERPHNYVENTIADIRPLNHFYQPKITLKEGLERTIFHEKSDSSSARE